MTKHRVIQSLTEIVIKNISFKKKINKTVTDIFLSAFHWTFEGNLSNTLTNLCLALYCIVFTLQYCTKAMTTIKNKAKQ